MTDTYPPSGSIREARTPRPCRRSHPQRWTLRRRQRSRRRRSRPAGERGGAGRVRPARPRQHRGRPRLWPARRSAARSSSIDQKTTSYDDGFLMSPSEDFRTPTHAIVSESADIEDGRGRVGPRHPPRNGFASAGARGQRPVSVGVGPATEVDRYLDDVEYDVVTDLEDEPRYSRLGGGEPHGPPGAQQFWAASTSGSGSRARLGARGRRRCAVVKNVDGRRGSRPSYASGRSSILSSGSASVLAAGALLAAGAALAITAGVRRRCR